MVLAVVRVDFDGAGEANAGPDGMEYFFVREMFWPVVNQRRFPSESPRPEAVAVRERDNLDVVELAEPPVHRRVAAQSRFDGVDVFCIFTETFLD